MTIIQFPLDKALASAKPLGRGVAWIVNDNTMLRADVIRGPGGDLWYRCEATGMPVRHYQGNISFNEVSKVYLEDNAF